jgi:hypothetical protein
MAVFSRPAARRRPASARAIPALDDNFVKPDPGWPNGDNVATTPQGLVVKPPVNGSTWAVNSNYTMDGSDLCVTVALPATLPSPANEDTVGDVGVVFWKRDNDNYYMAAISPDGIAVVSRYLNGQWLTIVNPIHSAAIKTGPGAVNEIEVTNRAMPAASTSTTQRSPISAVRRRRAAARPASMPKAARRVTTWVFSRVQLYSLPQ